ncbi:MAG: clan AA aspartic protease [Chloroflexi bacterium]|nr:clan AA aspartic protease [Chloroflexota bacterium]
MIEGIVNEHHEAVVALSVQGSSGQTHEIEAVIDTGYSGMLTLPPLMVSELDLAFRSSGRAMMANGAEEVFGTYDALVLWDGVMREVEVDALGPTPLAGMALLDQHRLCIVVTDGGQVTIEASR